MVSKPINGHDKKKTKENLQNIVICHAFFYCLIQKWSRLGPGLTQFSIFIVSNGLILFRFIVFVLFNTRLALPFCNLRALLSANKLCTMVFRCILLEGTSKAIVFFYLCLNHFFSGLRLQILVSPAQILSHGFAGYPSTGYFQDHFVYFVVACTFLILVAYVFCCQSA